MDNKLYFVSICFIVFVVKFTCQLVVTSTQNYIRENSHDFVNNLERKVQIKTTPTKVNLMVSTEASW